MKQQRGQTLVEILIGISIVGVIITAVTIAISASLNNTTFAKNQSIAAQYAQEGMEIVKQMQSSNYQTLNSLSGRYCLGQTCPTIATSGSCGPNAGGTGTNCSPNVNTNTLIRQVDILPAGSAQAKCVNTIQATVSVLWTDGKCPTGSYCHSEQIVSCFSNNAVVPMP